MALALKRNENPAGYDNSFCRLDPAGWFTLERNTREMLHSSPSPGFLTCRLSLGYKAVVKWALLHPG